nr:nonaspanin [Tanacetum cinerariifolium]
MNIDEYVAYVLADDNELHDVEGIDINLLPSDAPKTLNDVIGKFKPTQAQAQEPENVISLMNIENQNLFSQHGSDEMTFEEFLIYLGVVHAPRQVSYPQLIVQRHNDNIVRAYATGGRSNGHRFPSSSSAAPSEATINEPNQTTRLDASLTTNARRRHRMIRLTRQQVCDHL